MNQQLIEVTCCSVGMKGQGKTTITIKEILSAKPKYRLIFCFDHKHQVSYALKKKLAKTPKEFEELIQKALAGKDPWICYSPHEMFPGKVLQGYDFFCKVLCSIAKQTGDKVPKAHYCEELQEVVPSWNIQKYSGIIEALSSVRVEYVHNYFTAQMFDQFNKAMRFQCTKLHVFKHENGALVESVNKGYRIRPEMVQGLARGEHVKWESGKGLTLPKSKTKGVITMP